MQTSHNRLARLKFRSWHRGTREADFTLGCFFDRYHAQWSEAEIAWFEDLLEEEDVDVMDWAFCRERVPERFAGALMEALQRLDFVEIPR